MLTSVPRPAAVAAALMLSLLGAAYQVKGNVDLVAGTDPGAAIDLRGRDTEQAIFVSGANPFDHVTASQPPWGYPFGLFLTWPPWPEVRVYFALLNALALAFLMWWAYREPRDAPPEVRLLLMAAVFAFGGSCTATEVGQVSIIVTALLAGALWCDRAGQPVLCGLLVALALIKPTMSAPFAVALIVTGRFRAAASAALYGVVAMLFTWSVTGASPAHMLQQMAASAASYIGDGTLGIVDVLRAFGGVPTLLVAMAPVIVAIPSVALMLLSGSSLGLAFAVAAVWGRLWTYHKSYDDVMLVFLLVPIAIFALQKIPSRLALIAFGLLGAVSWIPGQLLALPAVQMLQLVVWPAVLALLVVLARQAQLADADGTSPERLTHLHA